MPGGQAVRAGDGCRIGRWRQVSVAGGGGWGTGPAGLAFHPCRTAHLPRGDAGGCVVCKPHWWCRFSFGQQAASVVRAARPPPDPVPPACHDPAQPPPHHRLCKCASRAAPALVAPRPIPAPAPAPAPALLPPPASAFTAHKVLGKPPLLFCLCVPPLPSQLIPPLGRLPPAGVPLAAAAAPPGAPRYRRVYLGADSDRP